MSLDPASVALKVAAKAAPKIAPLGKGAIRKLLGLNDVVTLLSLVKGDIRQSSVIPTGKHDLVWKRVSGQRSDPDIAGCLTAYLTRGDFAAARVRLRARLGELLRFDDETIDDGRVVELVVKSIEDNLSKAPLKDRDAMRLELALTRARIDDLSARRAGADAAAGHAVALEAALVPVGVNVGSPARLMRARSGVLAYAAREGLLAQLDDWTHGLGAFAACLIGGRGGSGKTRLGVELARHASRAGWLSGMLIPGAGSAAIQALVQIDAARLIVVDYAETRAEQLEILLPWLAETATTEHPVRVLLLVRSAPRHGSDWTAVLRHRSDVLDSVLDDVEQYLLEDLPLALADRHALFTGATEAFAARHTPALEVPAAVPAELEQPVFASPLMVVIAAYLAVHDPAGTVPQTRTALLDELLFHEERYWKASAKHEGLSTDQVLRRRIVTFATLAGADREAEATGLLRLVPDLSDASACERGRLARWVHNLYPSGPAWWNPLEPDLLGEHLVAATYTDHPDVLAGVLQRDKAHAVVQPLSVYARAAPDHSRLAAALQEIVTQRLGTLCELAVTQAATETDLDLLLGDTTLAAALDRAVTVIEPDPAILPAVLDVLPARSDLVLNPLALTLTAQLTSHRRRLAAANPAAYESVLSSSLNNLSVRLAGLGRRDEGLTAVEQAVSIYRRLAATDPATYEPALANSLNNLSVDLGDLGRHDEALTAVEQGVSIYRRLAAANPAAHQPDLARSLNNLSIDLGVLGRHDEALTAVEQGVSVHRRLAAANPAAHEPDLARSLNNLANCLAGVGRHDEALTAVEQAVSIYRRLAAANPAAHEPDLARWLNTLSNRLAGVGRHDEALTAVEQGVSIYRRLAAANPAAHEPVLARSLNNLSVYLADVGRHHEALTVIQEAVSIYRRLTAANPAAHEPHLARSLNNLCLRLAGVGRHDEALTVIQEAVSIYRRLAAANPAAYEPDLARSMNTLSKRLAEAGRRDEAERVQIKLAQLRRRAQPR